MDGAQDLNETTLARCRTTGRRIFWAKQEAKAEYESYLVLYPISPRADEVKKRVATL